MELNDAYKVLREIKEICNKNEDCDTCQFKYGDISCGVSFCSNGCPLTWEISDVEKAVIQKQEEEEQKKINPTDDDVIHHPGHYNFRGMECKDFIEKFVSDPKSYYEGNIFKYLYRYLEKNKEEDLNKAMEYTRLLKEYMYGKKD